MLSQPVTMYVHGSYPNSSSGGMYLCRVPKSDHIKLLSPRTKVTVYAVRGGSLEAQSGYAFVEAPGGAYGWVSVMATKDIGLSWTNNF